MTKLELLHTSALDAPTLLAARRFLDEAFDTLSETDWDHALGGVHALLWEDAELIGHASVVQRSLRHEDRALRCGYVEAVAVRADRRGQGHGAALMNAMESVITSAYDLGGLASSDAATGFYPARGWYLWKGTLSAFTPEGVVQTPEEADCVHVLPLGKPLDLTGELTCDWRDGSLW